MGKEVSVEVAALEGGIGCCNVSIQRMEEACRKLYKDYQKAGSAGWGDKKYEELGYIVEECCQSLSAPVNELNECIGKLQKLLEVVREYEGMNL